MAKELCPIPALIKCDVSPESMTVDLTVETNVSELIWTAVFEAPIDADRLLLQDGIPRVGDKNPFLPSKYATGLSPRKTNVPNVWDILVSYDIMGAPPIEEGFAYDFGSRSVTTEIAARGAYVRHVYEVIRAGEEGEGTLKLIPGKTEENAKGQIPLTTTAGQTYADPLMVVKPDVLLSFWMLSTKKTEEQVKNGSIYSFIGRTNKTPLQICGIPAAAYSLVIEDIVPTRYRYYAQGATEPEDRFKLRFQIRFDPSAVGFGTGVLSQGNKARLFPKGGAGGELSLRKIYPSDIDPSIVPEGSTNDREPIDYDILLSSEGLILDQTTSNISYVGNVVSNPFSSDELPLPGLVGNYATA